MNAADLKQRARKAKEYIAKIGAPEQHLREGSVGRFNKIEIETQIAHQASTGATNYWRDPYFDDALARIIKSDFAALSAKAVALMESDYATVRIAEKEALLAQLAEIEALEREHA